MTTFKLDLWINQGTDFSQVGVWTAGVPAAPVDLTGCTARMQVRASVKSPIVLLEFTTENGGITLGGTAGTIEYFRMNAIETAALTWRVGVYDLEIVFPGGRVQRKIAGAVTVSPEVTRV